MAKIKIDVYLEKNGQTIINQNVSAIRLDDKIKYKDQTINVFDIKTQVLKRISDDYSIELNFKEQNGVYVCSFTRIPITIKILKCILKDNFFYVKYEQEMLGEKDIFVYMVEVK